MIRYLQRLTLILALALAMGVGGYKLMDIYIQWANRPAQSQFNPPLPAPLARYRRRDRLTMRIAP